MKDESVRRIDHNPLNICLYCGAEGIIDFIQDSGKGKVDAAGVAENIEVNDYCSVGCENADQLNRIERMLKAILKPGSEYQKLLP